MHITRTLLDKATHQGVICADQAETLWAFLSAHSAHTPSFRFTHILYYFGGLIAIGAMTLFMTLGWERFGGWGLLLIALGYATAGIFLTEYLLYRLRLIIPAGIVTTFVVLLTPLAIYGLQSAVGFWPDGRAYRDYHTLIDWRWTVMELGTLWAGAVMLWRYRLPFLVMPIAATLWYISMDLTPFLVGGNDLIWEYRKEVSLYFGLLIVSLAFWVDIRTRHEKDYPFWLYLFGVVTFWSGLSLMHSDSELNKFLYFCINFLMIVVGAILSRRVFAIFGALGSVGYVAHLAYVVFKDSLLFPFILTAMGLGVIYLGIIWQRHEQNLSLRLRGWLPEPLRRIVDREY